MIVLLCHDLDAAGVDEFLLRARELELDVVPLEAGRGRAYEVVGDSRSGALELLGTPGVEQILSRRKRLTSGEPLWPHFAMRICILGLVLISVLALLAVLFPPPLLDRVGTPTTDAPVLEWYLRPPAAIVGWLPRAGPLIVSLLWIMLLLLPFMDRLDARSRTGRVVILGQRILTVALVLAGILMMLDRGAS